MIWERDYRSRPVSIDAIEVVQDSAPFDPFAGLPAQRIASQTQNAEKETAKIHVGLSGNDFLLNRLFQKHPRSFTYLMLLIITLSIGVWIGVAFIAATEAPPTTRQGE